MLASSPPYGWLFTAMEAVPLPYVHAFGLSRGVRLTDKGAQLVAAAVTEQLREVSSRAHQIALHCRRSVTTTDDVAWALKSLGHAVCKIMNAWHRQGVSQPFASLLLTLPSYLFPTAALLVSPFLGFDQPALPQTTTAWTASMNRRCLFPLGKKRN